MDSESTRLLQDLRAALLKAMTESREMRQALDQLRENGWSAYVVVDEAPEAPESAEGPAKPIAPARQLPGRQMSGADLSFLRSLGIDPRPEPRGAQ